MSDITPITLPAPIDWSSKVSSAEQHINDLKTVFDQNPLNYVNYIEALVEMALETRQSNRKAEAEYWMPYLTNPQENTLQAFLLEWMTYTPTTASPGLYIERWDYLINTTGGMKLAADAAFIPWFRKFLDFHGDWINSEASIGTLADWMVYGGSGAHPFDINDYERPDPNSVTGGFKSFNQFFLRNLKGGQRPMGSSDNPAKTVYAPCDGGVFFLDKGASTTTSYALPGKSDDFQLTEAIPGYGKLFEGGPLLDILLWFTDYHHFHAPVSGTIIDQGLYEGSYNYDFGDYSVKDHFAPNLSADSDQVGWYNQLGKHQRYVWVIRTEELGLVAMIAIGFWGVGSIINAVQKGDQIEAGQYMGHFGYGGSSIVLAFEPGKDLHFEVGNKPVASPNSPVLMKVRECLGKSGS
ncbi:MAG: phosphatidylserine decarboxylase [Salibacteraceae bacterium]